MDSLIQMDSLISEEQAVQYMRAACWSFGAFLVSAVYVMLGFHCYAFIEVICPLIKKRLGTELGLVWLAVGLVLLFNIVFNYWWAMVIKPGSPADQKMIEKMR